MRGVRDWYPLFMPLLVGGMERALQLAETMTARGFIAQSGQVHSPWMRGGLIGAMCLLIGGGLLHWVWASPVWGWLLLLSGVLLLAYVLWRAGRQIKHTRYRHTPWSRSDVLIAVAALLAVIPMWLKGAAVRVYTPYPALSVPTFDILVGLALLGLVMPVGGGSRKSQVES